MLSVVSLSLAFLGVAAAPDDLTVLNSHDFTIPVRVEAARKADVRELKLYCSRDLGKTWELVAAAPPEREAFAFRAPADGVYWFTVQVVDRAGKTSPASPFDVPPGLEVRVDTEDHKPSAKEAAELAALKAELAALKAEVAGLKTQVARVTEERDRLAARVQQARKILTEDDGPLPPPLDTAPPPF